MDAPNFQRLQKLLYVVLAAIAITLILINLEWLNMFHSAASFVNPRQDLFNSSSLLTEQKESEFEPDVFYALNNTRQNLANVTRGFASELQLALTTSLITTESVPTQITRAIIVFLPLNMAHFNMQFKALLLSISVMRSSQPVHVRTDFFVGTPPGGMNYAKSVGCTEDIRNEFADPEKCIVFEHVPLKDRPDKKHPLIPYSNYIDSMLVLSEFKYSSKYSVIMRTDLDTFVTPGFGKWVLPRGLAMVTGSGGYGSENANKHLSWIMKTKLGLLDEGLKSIGSTWIGQCGVLVAAAKLTVSAMIWLHTQEFSKYEIGAAGTDGWPYWHWPVLLLYGGHIAVNQIPIDRVLITTSDIGMVNVDFGTTTNSTMTDSILHLHCWHTEQLFSKFRFAMGQYKNLDLSPYLDLNSTSSYATAIAVSSDRLSLNQLAHLINDPSKVGDKSWIKIHPT